MAPPYLCDLLNEQMRGQLPQYIDRRREKGVSWLEISIEIRQDYGMKITGPTLHRWAKRYNGAK
jgi:intein-encoded DNA endonuclease-like protein